MTKKNPPGGGTDFEFNLGIPPDGGGLTEIPHHRGGDLPLLS